MQRDLIYDVGMELGEDTDYYLKKGFRVVAVEALPNYCELVGARLKDYVDSGQLTIVNAAIAAKPGPIKFFVNELTSGWSTASSELRDEKLSMGSPSTEVVMEGVTFASILEKHGIPYYMKTDIEGFDTLCLEGLKNFAVKPKYVSIESTTRSWSSLKYEFELLKILGYSKFQIVQQDTTCLQQMPKPAKEGLTIDFKFPFGGSGLFGEDLPDPWLSESEALHQYTKIFLRNKVFGNEALLRKFRLGKKLINFVRPQMSWHDTHATY